MHNHNVDDTEIKKFTNENAQWWDQAGPMEMLHKMNPLRLEYILSRTPLKAMEVADIGCGGGILSEALANENAFVTAIDMNHSAIQVASEHAKNQGLQINYHQMTAEALAEEKPDFFDVITCLEMLEHVPNPEAVIKACASALKPGGKIFFSTINRTPQAFLGAILGAEYILQLLPKGTHEFKKFIRPSELFAWANKHDLSFQHIQGVSFNPLTKTMKLTDSIHTNYITCYQKT
ncbi:MAG: bifunctional 3-demethylubiquinol 3-O-methyltransferase/2-polyprenyl-6-hydroxyphenol methylase [Coxiellaceae bacterium]|nr:bifunctional 3-demethylubiquinol 3-O-methyltransferase/2-polyprenyl-6-hydroxyphenol methylase [Coxiellaceae bacterium]|tara:strand:+ start:6150 stop:6851 length:702 start_codon:yes stop_codon:yes gene_type:complete